MHALIPRLFIIRKSQMSFDFGAHDHHKAYDRTNASGTVSHIQQKGTPTQAPQWEQKGRVMSYRVDFPDSAKKNHHIIASYQPKPGGWDYHYQLEERYTKDGKPKKVVHLVGKHSFESEAKNILLKEVGKKKQSIETAKKQPSWMHNADTRGR